MRIFVCIKQVPDTEAKILPKDGNQIDENGIKWVLNPYDEYAAEEALKLKDKISGSEVIVISVGKAKSQEAIRQVLAMGAERAVHVETDKSLDHQTIAKALSQVVRAEAEPAVIFMGKQAVDDDAYLTHIFLANELNYPVSTNVTEFSYADGKVNVKREIGGGNLESIEMATPCIVAASKGLNNPRYPTLPNIMKAKKKEIKKLSLADLSINDVQASFIIESLVIPPEKQEGKIIPGEPAEAGKELVKLLREEAKVI
ncbi:MAG: electron transfer flavoprotein subunit beta/FixA family protein [Pseudomonadota bacterium]